MGMFDSLLIELDGREQEIQTKRFDCVLARYRIGDWIGGVLPGVRVYFDRLDLDGNGRRVYGADAAVIRSLTLFIVLVQGVFVEYQLREGALAADAISAILCELRERWRDSARVQEFLVETLRSRQQRIATLEGQIGRIRSIVDDVRRLQAGENIGGVLGPFREEEHRLVAGEDPLAVIAWVLGDEQEESGLWRGDTVPDPLDEYRL